MTTLSFWRTIWAIFPVMTRRPWYGDDIGDEAIALLDSLAGTLTQERMQALNASVKFDGRTFAQAAAAFLGTRGIDTTGAEAGFWDDLAANTVQHLKLTVVALIAAVLAGVGAALALYSGVRRLPAPSSISAACCRPFPASRSWP